MAGRIAVFPGVTGREIAFPFRRISLAFLRALRAAPQNPMEPLGRLNLFSISLREMKESLGIWHIILSAIAAPFTHCLT